jgi:plastocyanin
MRLVRSVVVGACVAIIGLGGVAESHALASPSTGPARAASKTVNVKEVSGKYGFTPTKITVKVGTKVIWKNGTDAAHTVTGKGSFSSYNKQLAVGKSVSHVFSKAGTYHYSCTIHPYMKGTVVVTK